MDSGDRDINSSTGNDADAKPSKAAQFLEAAKEKAQSMKAGLKKGLNKAFASTHKKFATLIEHSDKEVKKHADTRGTSPSARAEAFQRTLGAQLFDMIRGMPQDISKVQEANRAALQKAQQEFVERVTSTALNLAHSAVYDKALRGGLQLIDFPRLQMAAIAPANIAKLNTATAVLLNHTDDTNAEYSSSYSHLAQSHSDAHKIIHLTALRAQAIAKQHQYNQAMAAANATMGRVPLVLRKTYGSMTAAELGNAFANNGMQNEADRVRQELTGKPGDPDLTQQLTDYTIMTTGDPNLQNDLIRDVGAAERAKASLTTATEALTSAGGSILTDEATIAGEYATLKQARDEIQRQTHGDKKDREHQLEIIDDAMCMNLLLQREIGVQKEAAVQEYLRKSTPAEDLQPELNAEIAAKDLVAEYLLAAPTLGKFTSARQSERLAAGLVGTFVGLTAVAGGWAANAAIPGLVQGSSMAAEAAAREAFTNPASVWERLSSLIASNQPIAGMDPSLFVSLLVVGSIVGAVVFTAAVTKFAHDIEQGKQSGTFKHTDAQTQIDNLKSLCDTTHDQYQAMYNKAQAPELASV